VGSPFGAGAFCEMAFIDMQYPQLGQSWYFIFFLGHENLGVPSRHETMDVRLLFLKEDSPILVPRNWVQAVTVLKHGVDW